jgi:hypothetical protein
MKEPTIEEVLKLMSFRRDEGGKLYIRTVHGSVHGSVYGNVYGNVGIVRGDVSDVFGTVWGIPSNILRDKVVELIKSLG